MDDPSRTGFYIGLGAAFAFENFSFDTEKLGMTGILPPNLDPGYDNSQGAHIQLGYRVHRSVGLEFLYEFLEGFDSTPMARVTARCCAGLKQAHRAANPTRLHWSV